MMKIGLICPNFPPTKLEGGISHFTGCLVRHLTELGDEVVIITGNGYRGPEIDAKVTVLKFAERWGHDVVRQMADQLKVRGIEAINLQYSPVMYPWPFKLAWNCLARNFISTVSLHTLWGGSKLNHLFAFKLLYTANGVIATNSEVAYLLRKYFPFFLKKTRHIPIGSNIKSKISQQSIQEKVKTKFSIKPGEMILSYFGMAYPGKGMELLFETANILKCKYNLDFKLLVIGGGISDVPEYIQEKRKLVSARGLSDNVIFTGRIASNEVSELLNASNLVVLPFASGVSDRRGSLMAALAHHKAIITTKPACTIDLFKNGENLVWPGQATAENLAELAKRVLQDTVFRQRLENGAKALTLNYDWEDIAAKTRQFFQELISNGSSSRSAPTG